MVIINRIVKYACYFSLILLSLIGSYIVFSIIFSVIEVQSHQEKVNDVHIFILTNGVHTDLVVPVKNSIFDWGKKIKFENTQGKDSIMEYLALGWGDRQFYIETPGWTNLKFKTALKAIFGLGTAAIHTAYLKSLREGQNCKRINLSKNQYFKLVEFISNSFINDKNGNFKIITPNAYYGYNDSFYEAKGRFTLFYTCNTWANNGLKACGQKACLWTPFDKGIFYHYND